MTYCSDCEISISSNTDRCPLCQKELPHDENQNAVRDYPAYEPITENSKKRAISMVACILIILSVAGNILMWKGEVWCVVFSACVLYAWGLGLQTFSKRIHLGWKLTANAIAIPLLLVVINVFASSAETIAKVSWAVSYTMPAIFLGFIIVINFIIIKWRQRRRDYMLYQLSLCVICFVPLILVLSGVAQPIYPSMIAAGCALMTIIWLIVFAQKVIGSELVRKFHL